MRHPARTVVERVVLDSLASDSEVRAVEEVLHDAGIDAKVDANWTKPSDVGNGAFWMVMLILGVSASHFLQGFAQKAGGDAWVALKSFVGRLREARRKSTMGPSGWVQLTDSEGTVILIGDEAEQAYRELLELDLDRRQGWMLLWDDEAREWYDPSKRE